MRADQYQRYAIKQFRLASCLVAVIFVGGVAAAGCGGGSSASNDGSGSGGSAATGTGGTVGGTGGKKADGGGSGGSIIRPDAGAATGLGMACTSSATCGAGLTCLLPTDKSIFGSAGPAHGYCTLPCAATGAPTAMADLAACDAAGGSCVDFALDATSPSQAYCMLNCLQGPSPAGTMKCNGRGDVACETLGASDDGGVSQDICIPVCSQDSDCPSGRKCDERFSVCVDTPNAGAPLGTHCDPMAATSTCAGGCLPVGMGTTMYSSFCTRRCVFGFVDVCNWVDKPMSLATGGPHGVCVFVGANSDVGDEGFCSQQCDTPADCTDQTDPMLSCDTTITQLGHGFCAWGPRAATDGGTGG
ncbi:MAG TPA: hypothetical protein VNO55_24625 [Polyangia bacterium]|nr:hypothetical protein [Polyangia bacterium]